MTVENIQQVRAVWNGEHWELHLICKVEIPVEDAAGDNTAGIDLDISNHLAIAYDDGDAELYLEERLETGQALLHPRRVRNGRRERVIKACVNRSAEVVAVKGPLPTRPRQTRR